MRCHQTGKLGSAAEKHVTGFYGTRMFDFRSEARNMRERAGNALWVPRKLHRRGVGEKLALTRYARLNDTPAQHADRAHDDQHQSTQRQRSTIASARAVQQDAPTERKQQDSVQNGHEAQIEAHVAVQDMAELMCDHAL